MSKFPYFVSNQKVFLTLYLVINSLFVLKYSERIKLLPSFMFVLLYNVMVLSVFMLYKRLSSFLNSIRNLNIFLLGGSLIFFCLFLFINFKIDGLSLNIDRWSALEVLIKSILEGKYPYAVLDHLDNTTSNLPGLFFIGLPFYLLGGVDLLQPFMFLFLSLFVIYSKIKNDEKVFIFLLILMAPSYFWEIIAKSDLMSNCILLLIFISFWQQKYKNDLFKNESLLAFLLALFVLTRGIVVIPLTIFLFTDFLKITLKKKLVLSGYFLLFIGLVSLPVFIDLPSTEFIKEHNPFNHQTRYAPKILIIVSLLLPFLFSFKVKVSSDVFLYTIYVLASLMFVTFVLNCLEEGFYENIYGNLFDISYLSMVLPFIVFYFLEKFKNQNNSFLENNK